MFADALVSSNFLNIKVADFKKKSLSKKKLFDRKLDFTSRCNPIKDAMKSMDDACEKNPHHQPIDAVVFI